MIQRNIFAPILLTALAVGVSAPPAASAGIADSPLPQFADGKPSVVVLAVSGVVKKDRLQTDFQCTVLDSVAVDVAVEIFGPDGTLQNDVQAGNGALLNVAPGQTVTFGTTGTVAYLESAVITLAAVSQGSARVVASSDRVSCNAVVLDKAVTPPASISALGDGFRPAPGAGLASAPLPTFADNQPALFAALVPGVIKKHPMDTTFMCTSLASGNIDLGVEVFAPDGTIQNDISTGNGAVLNVAPGVTVTLSTTGTASLLETAVISTALVGQGLGRIVSTSAQVLCAVLVLDASTSPPAAMSDLPGSPSASLGDANHDGVTNAADVPAVIRHIFQ